MGEISEEGNKDGEENKEEGEKKDEGTEKGEGADDATVKEVVYQGTLSALSHLVTNQGLLVKV